MNIEYHREIGITASALSSEISELHDQCGIYTKRGMVEQLLNAVGWTNGSDLSNVRLLEPAAGDGAFLVEAARRLAQSLRLRGKRRTFSVMQDRITAFELHTVEARRARRLVSNVLQDEGITQDTANRLAKSWILRQDFLLATQSSKPFTHIVGNPPYVRWSRIPVHLRKSYEAALPKVSARGDLSLSFLHQAMLRLSPNGRLAFLCTDRWLHAAYGGDFREQILADYVIERQQAVQSRVAFERAVGTNARMFVIRRRKGASRKKSPKVRRTGTRAKWQQYISWRAQYPTLKELGCKIRVGPALGPEKAFVDKLENFNIESELLAPFIGPSEIETSGLRWDERYVICMYGEDGKLRDPSEYPELSRRLRRYKEALTSRSIVRNGAPWYRTIDRVRAIDWKKPKVLLPEMAKEPRLILDRKGCVPAHGVYAIFPPDGISARKLFDALSGETFWTSLQAIAPRTKGGTLRCYKRFLEELPINLK